MKNKRRFYDFMTVARPRSLVVASALVSMFASSYAFAAEKESGPNIVIIYGDDVGFGDVGVNGATQIPTPNIDALASASLNFTDGHCSSATCTPSRYSLLTGVHAFRAGVHIAPPNAALLIDPEGMTLPRLFKKAGYRTGMIGKWHLGLGEKGAGPQWNGVLKPGPMELGFDSSYIMPTTNDRVPCVYVDGHRVENLDPADPIHVGNQYSEVNQEGSTQYPDAKENPEAFYSSIVNGIGRIGYMSGGKSALWDDTTMADVFVDKAKHFISEHKDEKFFLYFASQDIHFPNAPNARFTGKTKLGKRGDAMVQLDWSVGEILKQLDKEGLSENTIVIFSSDNGPVNHDDSNDDVTKQVRAYSRQMKHGHDASGKWRGGKYEIYEGGTRVPLMIRWPNHIEPGTSDALVNQIDLLASFASQLGVELADSEARDSRNTWGAFTGEDGDGLQFTIEEARCPALRFGDWKYIPGLDAPQANGFSPLKDTLYDLSKDPEEKNNVIAEYPELASSLAARLKSLTKSKGIRAVAAETTKTGVSNP